MATYSECLAALSDFRNDLLRGQQDMPQAFAARPMNARGAFSAMSSPAANIHATGIGIRQRAGVYDSEEQVLKVYVFDKVSREEAGETAVASAYRDIPVDVEQLPVQIVRQSGTPPQRKRHRPIPGGVSISPLDVDYVGTLGCYLRRRRVDIEEIFALSNNHVLADVDRLPRGTHIVQPGPEVPPFATDPNDSFATLRMTIPIRFPTDTNSIPINRFDAAIANISDINLVKTGAMFGIKKYDPSRVVAPVPGMLVTKSGRTTGVTHGRVTAVSVDGVHVNYGIPGVPRIAVFDGTIEIVSVDEGKPFSSPGDSGSVILEEETGHPTALLFAGDGVNTTACDLGLLCRRLRAWPI